MAREVSLQVDSYGIEWLLTAVDPTGAALDISAATLVELSLQDPAGVCTHKTMGFVDDGSDGQVDYTLVEGDIDQPGYWYWQLIVTFDTDAVWYSERVRIRVLANNNEPAP